jgi:WD40 repeat protein
LKTISILKGQHSRGICSMSFSSKFIFVFFGSPLATRNLYFWIADDGKKLASVGLDDYHMICVWNWRKGEVLATTRGSQDKIFSIKWNPHDSDKLTTVGVKHMKFWNQIGE